MNLFQHSVLNKYLKGLESEKVNKAYERFTSHFHNPTIQENIRNSKEEQYQGEFLIDLFVNVLGYTKNPTPDFNLTTELKNIKGSKKTDGAILKGEKALAVIELKGTNTTDLSKVETQAFGYKNNQPGCNYVITSNFEKLRFYIDNAVDFEEFNLFQLSKERFDILWLCLSSGYLLKDIPKKIKNESLTQEENVTKKLYKDYASFRNEIFDAIQNENPEYDKLTLFKKTQKLLDRFLFIFFAEDRLLLPPNSIRSIVNQWTDLRDKYDEYFPLYDRFKKYFGYMNTGHKGQQHDIFAYNGGLFAPDEILDNIKINDDLLHKHTINLSNYDFESEVSVNILGHIFEHSLNDIDEIQAEIQGAKPEQSKTKRKKDGVFYTPKYITKYIVDNTVGKLCEEKKTELDIQESEYEKERKGRQKATLKKLSQKLEDYRKWLLQITICDPACGSGAFLNQALEFLIAEHRYIDELQAKLLGDAMVLSEVENAILENNIYGVDINEESVEIAKLSLWLRTAQKGRKLTSLNNNIKCGNSLIDDPAIAGDKAFHWQNEFPDIFKEKDKKAYHITTALHDSRTSQRMIDYKVRERRNLGANPFPNYTKLTTEEEICITKEIIAIAEDNRLNIMAYNVCGDHIHLLLVCEAQELSTLVKNIKGRTARAHNSNNKGINPLVQKENEKSVSLWTQKYGCKEIKDDEQLYNTIAYIQNNRATHELPTGKKLQSLVNNPTLNQSYDTVFATTCTGGFDVIIGNPPYGATFDSREKEYLKSQFKNSTTGKIDSYRIFINHAIFIAKTNGLVSFIIPNTFLYNVQSFGLRKILLSNTQIYDAIELRKNIFQDAPDVVTVIFSFKNAPKEEYSFQARVAFHNERYLDIDTSLWAINQQLPVTVLKKDKDLKINLRSNIRFDSINEKLKAFPVLSDFFNFRQGTKPYGSKTDKTIELISKNRKETNWEKAVNGRNISRYFLDFENDYVLRSDKLHSVMDSSIVKGEKIYFQRMRKISLFPRIVACYDNENFHGLYTCSIIWKKEDENVDLKFCLAIINSLLINLWFKYFDTDIEIKLTSVKQIPIPSASYTEQKPLIQIVNILIDLKKDFIKLNGQIPSLLNSKYGILKFSKKLQNWHELDFGEFIKELEKACKKEAKNANKGLKPLALSEEAEWMQYFNEQKQKAEKLKTEIDKTDKAIDQMVYELYGLTEEEIAIVEEATT